MEPIKRIREPFYWFPQNNAISLGILSYGEQMSTAFFKNDLPKVGRPDLKENATPDESGI